MISKLEAEVNESREIHEKNVRDVRRASDRQLQEANDEIRVGSIRLCSFILYFIDLLA
jgi:hypothetical protein